MVHLLQLSTLYCFLETKLKKLLFILGFLICANSSCVFASVQNVSLKNINLREAEVVQPPSEGCDENECFTHGMTIPVAHPRLWWNASRLAIAQSWCTANPTQCASNSAAWKHVVTGSSCATDIAALMEFDLAGANYSGDGFYDPMRASAYTYILTYDWCFDELTTQQKSDFLVNLDGTGDGWNDYMAFVDSPSATRGQPSELSNYSMGFLRNDIMFGIATYTENTTAAESALDYGFDTRWTQYMIPAMNAAPFTGGVPAEGYPYGASTNEYFIYPFQSVEILGKDIVSESNFLKQNVYAVIYGTTPSITYHENLNDYFYLLPFFGDDEHFIDGGTLHIRTYYQNYMNFASNFFSSINVGKDARQWWNTVSADDGTKATTKDILSLDASPAARATSNIPLDYYATGMSFLFGRKAWDTSSAYFMFQMKSGAGHAHADTGTFNIWRGGRWLTRETAGYGETITGYGYRDLGNVSTDGDYGSLVAHNTIAFSTPLYTNDIQMMPSVHEGVDVERLESAIGYSYADVDMTGRYQWRGYDQYERGAVVHVEREFLFLRDLETIVILDRLTTGNVVMGIDEGVTAADEVNTFLLHSETEPSLDDANHITITNGTQVLHVTTLVPATPDAVRSINERSCSGCSPIQGQYRIEIDTSGAAQRYFLNVLQARDTSGSNLTASVVDSTPADPTTGTFTVTLHPATGSDTTIVFNKGQTSSGGTVNLAGAGAVNLRSDVQGITYTDNGPVWGE